MNTTINAIVTEIKARGFKVKTEEVMKNNAMLTGLIFRNDSNLSPCIYLDHFVEEIDKGNKVLGDVVEDIITLYKTNQQPSLDIKNLFTSEYLNTHIYMGVQQNTTEDIIKNPTEYEGIESYLYIEVDKNIQGTFKLPRKVVNHFEFDVDELWNKAKENTFAEVVCKEFPMLPGMGLPILTNTSHTKGAVAMLNKEFIKSLNLGDELVIIPSSIHEVIVLPTSKLEPEQIDTLSAMVREVNATEVAPQEVLSDKAYIVNVDTWTVKTI